MLPRAIADQDFQMVGGRNTQVDQSRGRVEHRQLAPGHRHKVCGETLTALTRGQNGLAAQVLEALNSRRALTLTLVS